MNFLHKIRSFGRDTVIHPLGGLLLLLLLLYAFLVIVHPNTRFADFDAIILLFISVVFALSALFMVTRTPWDRWSLLGAGLLATFTADSILYFMSSLNTLIVWFDTPDYVLVFVRSSFMLGGVWILMGLLIEWYYEQKGERRQWKYILTHPWVIFTVSKKKKEEINESI